MGITAINTAATSKFVSTLDSGYDKDGNHSPESTFWELGAMDSYIQSHVSSKSTSYSFKSDIDVAASAEDVNKSVDISVDIHGMAIETCRLCIRGWDNFKDHLGNDIPFKTKKTNIKGRMYDAVDPDLLARINKDVLMEIYGEVNRISDLTEEEIKN